MAHVCLHFVLHQLTGGPASVTYLRDGFSMGLLPYYLFHSLLWVLQILMHVLLTDIMSLSLCKQKGLTNKHWPRGRGRGDIAYPLEIDLSDMGILLLMEIPVSFWNGRRV